MPTGSCATRCRSGPLARCRSSKTSRGGALTPACCRPRRAATTAAPLPAARRRHGHSVADDRRASRHAHRAPACVCRPRVDVRPVAALTDRGVAAVHRWRTRSRAASRRRPTRWIFGGGKTNGAGCACTANTASALSSASSRSGLAGRRAVSSLSARRGRSGRGDRVNFPWPCPRWVDARRQQARGRR